MIGTSHTIDLDASPRRSGRTTRMIRWVGQGGEPGTRRVMLVENSELAAMFHRVALEMGFTVERWQFCAYDKLASISTEAPGDTFEYGVDNADAILERLLGGRGRPIPIARASWASD